MVLCLLVYLLAEQRLREQLAATGQTVPNQLKQPTDRPTMRWMFQCFEGVSLVAFQPPQGPPHRELAGLEPLHSQVVTLLGPLAKDSTNSTTETADYGLRAPSSARPGCRACCDQYPNIPNNITLLQPANCEAQVVSSATRRIVSCAFACRWAHCQGSVPA